jgi:hypothetical protein
MDANAVDTIKTEFNTLIDKFKDQIDTYPTIAQFWITYLEKKKQNVAEILAQSEYVIAQMQENGMKDITMDDLMRLMLFKMTL